MVYHPGICNGCLIYLIIISIKSEKMGTGLSVEQQIEINTKLINRQDRALKREILTITRDKQKLTDSIKLNAKNGNHELMNLQANQFLIYKNNILKLEKLRIQMSTVKQKIQMMKSTNDINKVITSLTNTMKQMNQTMNLPNINKLIMEYDFQQSKQDIIMGQFDDALEEEDVDVEEQENIVNMVFDEIGITLSNNLARPPQSPKPDIINQQLVDRFNALSR